MTLERPLPMKLVLLSTSSLALLVPMTRAGNVLVVDTNGGGQFFRIQRAIDAASDGDTILVKTGVYPGFTIDDKSVAVVADTGQDVSVAGGVLIRDLAAYRDVLLLGLTIAQNTPNQSPASAVYLYHNDGSVRFEECLLQGVGGGVPSGDGADVHYSADVAFARCQLVGGSEGFAGSGLDCEDSRVALYDSSFQGGTSSDHFGFDGHCYGADGGRGLWAHDGVPAFSTFVFAAGSSFAGGNGGSGGFGPGIGCQCGNDTGSGGWGLWADVGAPVHLLDDAFAGGHAGTSPPCVTCCFTLGGCCPGSDGFGFHGPGAEFFDGGSRHLGIASPQRENSTVPLRLDGAAGDMAYLFLSSRTSFRFVAGYRGVQLTQQPGPPMFLGTLDSAGVLNGQLHLPELGIGEPSATLFLQAAVRDLQGRWTFSSPVSLVVLDQAF